MCDFYQPAEEIRTLGRSLRSGSFFDLIGQIHSGEMLWGLYCRDDDRLLAAHLPSESRMREIERLYQPCRGYGAVCQSQISPDR